MALCYSISTVSSGEQGSRDILSAAEVSHNIPSIISELAARLTWWSSRCGRPETMIAPTGPTSFPLIQIGTPPPAQANSGNGKPTASAVLPDALSLEYQLNP